MQLIKALIVNIGFRDLQIPQDKFSTRIKSIDF